jgi:citrate lyase beta subunit
VEDLVLNIRVGGNDLCHMFGFRRHCDESIHLIRPVADIFSDIITVYGMDYVVSGPVWEYYSGYNWENGLIQELKDDKLCGFTGKTVIHPNQISVVNKVYQVTRSDFNDAKAILNWDKKSDSLVSGNLAGERMNEYKTHHNWAEKILFLAEVFGITD